jgi:hypothetical protein
LVVEEVGALIADGYPELAEHAAAFHSSASFEEVLRGLEGDGLRVVTFAEHVAARIRPRSEAETRAALEALREHHVEPECIAALTYCASGRGSVPPPSDALESSGLLLELGHALPAELETWNALDLRALDVLVAGVRGGRRGVPGITPSTPEAGIDRFGLLGGWLRDRGVDPIAITVDAPDEVAGTGFYIGPTGRLQLAAELMESPALLRRITTTARSPATRRENLRNFVGEVLGATRAAPLREAMVRYLADEVLGSALIESSADLLAHDDACFNESVLAVARRHLRLDAVDDAWRVASALRERHPDLALEVARAAAAAVQQGRLPVDLGFLEVLAPVDSTSAWLTVAALAARMPDAVEVALVCIERSGKGPIPAAARARLLTAAAADASVHDALEKPLAARGLDVPAFVVPPLSSLELSAELSTDMALLFLFDPRAKGAGAILERAGEPAFMKTVLKGKAAVWATGGDGTFRARLTGRELTAADRKLVKAEASFALAVTAERLKLTGGSDAGWTLACPSGSYAVTVHVMSEGDTAYVVTLSSTGSTAKHAEPPLLER